MINSYNYSKIRLMISIIFSAILLFILFLTVNNFLMLNSESIANFSHCNPCNSEFQQLKDYFETFLIITGMVLFTFNRRFTDYISFIIFVFLSTIVPVEVLQKGYLQTQDVGDYTTVLIINTLFFSLPIIFLISNIFAI